MLLRNKGILYVRIVVLLHIINIFTVKLPCYIIIATYSADYISVLCYVMYSFQACRLHGNVPNATDAAGPGVSHVDFLLYVIALSVSRCSKTVLAFSRACQLEPIIDR